MKIQARIKSIYEFNDFGFKFKVQWNPTKENGITIKIKMDFIM